MNLSFFGRLPGRARAFLAAHPAGPIALLIIIIGAPLAHSAGQPGQAVDFFRWSLETYGIILIVAAAGKGNLEASNDAVPDSFWMSLSLALMEQALVLWAALSMLNRFHATVAPTLIRVMDLPGGMVVLFVLAALLAHCLAMLVPARWRSRPALGFIVTGIGAGSTPPGRATELVLTDSGHLSRSHAALDAAATLLLVCAMPVQPARVVARIIAVPEQGAWRLRVACSSGWQAALVPNAALRWEMFACLAGTAAFTKLVGHSDAALYQGYGRWAPLARCYLEQQQGAHGALHHAPARHTGTLLAAMYFSSIELLQGFFDENHDLLVELASAIDAGEDIDSAALGRFQRRVRGTLLRDDR